jgi:hypothetical protein
MRLTVFTGNQPRHLSLVESLAAFARHVFAVQECRTVFPGRLDDAFRKSEAMQEYFSRAAAAEEEIFGRLRFLPRNVNQLAVRRGDLNLIDVDDLGPALASDAFVVCGAGPVEGPLADLLIERGAVHVRMGTSPYYRGDLCNFWALRDGRPEYVGATVHRLSKGADSGPILFHALPEARPMDSFALDMEAVRAAHIGIVHYLDNGEIMRMDAIPQDRGQEIRASRREDFTDEVAREYLRRLPSARKIGQALGDRDESRFVRPFIG